MAGPGLAGAATRTVPQNYLEITLNAAKLDWLAGVPNYDMMLKQAAELNVESQRFEIEEATDKCEDVADVLEAVATKNA